MTKHIAILRGINVGGHKKILMADLKTLFGNLGFKNVVTYIQSGNVAFNADNNLSPDDVIRKIEHGITEHYGFDVPVILRNRAEINAIIERNPYLEPNESNIKQVFLAYLSQEPEQEGIDRLNAVDFKDDVYTILGRDMYICYGEKISVSKLSHAVIESKLKVKATIRNWKTTRKLHELINT